MAVQIPIRNIWWLMMFASDSSGAILSRRRSVEDIEEDLPDLVAQLLCEEVSKRFRQKLSVDYKVVGANLNRLRGRIDVLTTIRKSLLAKGKVAVRYSEISHDNDVNRLALLALTKLSNITSGNRRIEIKAAIGKLRSAGVEDLGILWQPNRVQAKVRADMKLVSLSKLALSLQLITEQLGPGKFFEVDKDPSLLRKLFESGVRGFYKYHLSSPEWRVTGGHKFPWNLSEETEGFKSLMPQMVTDIEIEHLPTKKKLIIDTKFASVVTKGLWKETFKSGHLYQINAYMDAARQQAIESSLDWEIEGMLLYPAIAKEFTESAILAGSRLRLATVNLDSAPSEISKTLLKLISSS